MAYQSLYRRYRSQRFAEVLGQDHITGALRNAVREARVGHGYLFTGPRGTGKTSTARILAKVLNCLEPDGGEPCAVCENCRAVEEGRSVDWLHELDAASNNGVDAMRDLLGRVSMGTSGNRKVYILDEVHMLSKGAANTLLKTLEEPPEHVVFVLATTEPEKVLPTIQSRTQRFDFKLLPAGVLADHVRHVIDDAGLALGEDAVDYVVRAGGGSARDTLSALDQVAAAGGVEEVVTPITDLIGALGARDAGAALGAVDSLVRSGQHPRTLAESLISALREAFLVAMGAPADGLSEQAVVDASATAESLGPATLTAAMETIGSAMIEMRHAPDPRIPLEVALVRLTSVDRSTDLGAIEARVAKLEASAASGGGTSPEATSSPDLRQPRPSTASENADPPTAPPQSAETPGPSGGDRPRGAAAARASLAKGNAGEPAAHAETAASSDRPSLGGVRQAQGAVTAAQAPETGTASPASAEAFPSQDEAEHEPDTEVTPAASSEPISLEGIQARWDGILGSLKGKAKALYKLGEFVSVEGHVATLSVPNDAHRTQAESKRAEVEAALTTELGRQVALNLVVAGETTEGPRSEPTDGAADRSGVDQAGTAPDPAAATEAEAASIDLDELTDAPNPEAGGLAQLKDAFPGAELLEE